MFWWVRWIFVAGLSVFFLVFGIEEMAQAYKTSNPGEFLAWFFSASFIILISGTLLVGSLWRMIHRLRSGPDGSSSPTGPPGENHKPPD